MQINGYRTGRFHKGNASRLGKLGVEARAKKRLENPSETKPRRVPKGELLGILQWHAADGEVKRWVIKQGARANGIAVLSKQRKVECGWDRLFRFLRKHLSVPKRIFA